MTKKPPRPPDASNITKPSTVSPSSRSSDDIGDQHLVSERAYFSGPLPPPTILKEYNSVLPGAAERIIAMAEEQGKHRRELEKKALSTDSCNSLLGIIFAFALGLSTIGCGTYCIVQGQQISGTIIGGVGLVGLVSVFIYGTRHRSKERKDKLNPPRE